jgi:hypothetical protein
MVRNGSKLLIGLAAASLVSLVVYGATQSWGALGGVGLAGALAAFILLAVLAVESGEGDVDPTTSAAATAAATAPAPGASMWPLAGALGAGLVVVGLVTHQVVFILGVGALVAVFVEWLMQAWAERASADRGYNVEVRRRLMFPLELPIAATLGLGVVIWSFSRVMLAVDKSTGTILFIVAAAVVLLFGFLFALRPKVGRTLVAAICTIGGVGVVAAGIAGASSGERQQLVEAYEEGHYTHKKCGPERDEYFDKHALRHVSMKSALSARVILEDGRLRGEMLGIGEQSSITIARMNPSDILFENRDTGDYRLAVYLGQAPRTDEAGNVVNGPDGEPLLEDVIDCTQLKAPDEEGLLTLTVPKPSISDPNGFRLYIPGLPEAEIKLVVP